MRRSLSLLNVDHIEPQEHIIHVGKDADQDPTVLLLSASFGHNQAQRLYRTSCSVCVCISKSSLNVLTAFVFLLLLLLHNRCGVTPTELPAEEGKYWFALRLSSFTTWLEAVSFLLCRPWECVHPCSFPPHTHTHHYRSVNTGLVCLLKLKLL